MRAAFGAALADFATSGAFARAAAGATAFVAVSFARTFSSTRCVARSVDVLASDCTLLRGVVIAAAFTAFEEVATSDAADFATCVLALGEDDDVVVSEFVGWTVATCGAEDFAWTAP